jgi:hypothetical protein
VQAALAIVALLQEQLATAAARVMTAQLLAILAVGSSVLNVLKS